MEEKIYIQRLERLKLLNECINNNIAYGECSTTLISLVVQELGFSEFIFFNRLNDDFSIEKNYKVIFNSSIFNSINNNVIKNENDIFSIINNKKDQLNIETFDLKKNYTKYIQHYIENSKEQSKEKNETVRFYRGVKIGGNQNRNKTKIIYSYIFCTETENYSVIEFFSDGEISNFDKVYLEHVLSSIQKFVNGKKQFINEVSNNLRREKLKNYFSEETIRLLEKEFSNRHQFRKKRLLVSSFLDIRDFSNYSLKTDPDELFEKLNTFFTIVKTIIIKNQGSVNGYAGDGVFSNWGISCDNIIENITNSVLACIEILKALKTHQEKNDIPTEWKVGLGLSVGNCIIGNLGNGDELEPIVIGNSINIASHLTDQASNEIIIDESIIPFFQRDHFLNTLEIKKEEKAIQTKKGKEYKVLTLSL